MQMMAHLHLVSIDGIRTHDLSHMSLLPYPWDQEPISYEKFRVELVL